MTINKITHETRNKIISKSVSPLPNNPGRAGYKADAVKKAMFDFVTGSEDSILAEINRIVDELNVCLSGFGIEGIKISLANKADKDDIPDVSKFITRLVSDLENYYLKSETYSQQEIDNKISSIPKFNTKVVTVLPTDNISNTTVYLLKSDSTDTDNIYTEYIYAESSWEVLGSQRFDLSGYLTIDVFNTTISKYYTSASVDTLLQNKVDKIQGKSLTTNDYTTEEKNKLKGIETGAQVNTVNKVNGKTGDIELTAEDVGALPSDTEMFSGSYNDLTDKPDLFDGNYNDLSNKPTIPTTAEDVNALPDSTKFATGINLTINETDYKVTVQLIDQDGNSIGSSKTIDLPLESVVVGGSYDEATKKVVLSLQSGTDISFSVADLVSGLQSKIEDLDTIRSNASAGKSASDAIKGYGDVVTHNASEFAKSTDLSLYLPLTGGTLNGNLSAAGFVQGHTLISNGDVQAQYLQAAAAGHETGTYDKIATLSSTGYVRYRTKAELKSDLGGASYSLNGTTLTITL